MNLDQRWSEVEEQIARRKLLVFPNRPMGMGPDSEDFLAWPVALWPEERSLDEFLDLAAALSVRLVYAWRTRFEPKDLEELLSRAEELSEDWNTTFPDRPLSLIDREVRRYVGQVRSITVQFSYGGVFHEWQQEATWAERVHLPDWEGIEELSKVALYHKHEDRIDEWADPLARAEEFQQAPKGPLRVEVAIRLTPELSALRERHGDAVLHMLADGLVAAAHRRYLDLVVPERERELAKAGRELMANGLSRKDAAGRLGMGSDKLARLLAQYP